MTEDNEPEPIEPSRYCIFCNDADSLDTVGEVCQVCGRTLGDGT